MVEFTISNIYWVIFVLVFHEQLITSTKFNNSVSLNQLNNSFNVGLLMVKRYRKDAVRFDLVHIGPAIDIAREKCLNYYDINLNINQGYYENTCKEREAIGQAYDLLEKYKGNLVGFIGPACSNDLQAVSQLAAYKKIPILTGLGDIIPIHRSDLTSLIRLSYDMRDKARAILAFLDYFKWKIFGLVFRFGDVYYNTLADVLLKLLKLPKYSHFKCNCRETYFRDFDKVIITDIDQVLRRMKTCSRIIIILGGDKDVRTILLKAHHQGMTQGDYVFIYPELIEAEALGNMSWSRGVEDELIANQLKTAYQSLLIVSLNQPPGDHYKNFSDEVKFRAYRDYGYQYNEHFVNYFTASFHDAVLLLCRAIRETLNDDHDPHDGVLLVQRMRNLTLNGISGDITIDEEGDRIADYALLDQTNIDDGLFEVVLRYYGATKSFTKEKEIKWPPGKFGVKPKDIPECGFKGNACDKDLPYWNILLATLLIIIALILVASTFIYHKVKLEAALANMSWKVRWEDIILDQGPRQSFMSKITSSSQGELNEINHNEGKIICAHYKGNRVAIKKLPSHKIEVTREILMELKIMRETSHENLARFIGACIDVPNVILTEYCPKGSLRDLLMNFSLNLDWMFRFSLINDIIAGMCYLHSSEHIFHGRLKSTNCLVDSRFCIKLSDFGLEKLRSAASITANNSSGDNCHQQPNKSSSKTLISTTEPHLTISVQTNDVISNGQTDPYSVLYISPDMLNNDFTKSNYVNSPIEIEKNKCRCTEVSKYKLRRCYDCVYRGQKADVYSYSIILQEIITRSFPFHPYVLCMDIKTIVNNIAQHDLRPDVPLEMCENKELYHHMVRCWSREPHSRPDFNYIKREIRLIARSSGQNEDSPENTTLTEKLLQRMEQYATELESIVEQRTSELAEEKKKTEELLYQILPRVVANQLKIGESVIPDYYESVTVYFSDIVGFTAMCSESTPIEVVNFLNDLYTCFDSIISDYDVYKVETIGDAYMVVSGLPERNGHEHVRQIARMSLRMVESVEGFVIRHRKDDKLKLRIGIHSGPCCAGVVGNKRPRYCLFGDTINTASRMESTGEALKIHISSATKKLLDYFKQFEIQERGDVIIKGKGIMKTYWLLREKHTRRSYQNKCSTRKLNNFTLETIESPQKLS